MKSHVWVRFDGELIVLTRGKSKTHTSYVGFKCAIKALIVAGCEYLGEL